MLTTFLPHGLERAAMSVGAVLGGVMSFAFGDVGPLLARLIIFICIDFATGTVAAFMTHSWTSHNCGIGITKKALYLGIVALAHGLDVTFQPLLQIQVVQSITICAYACGEIGSIVEKLERAGYGSVVPPVIRRLVSAMDDKVEGAVDRVAGKGNRSGEA